MIGVTKKVFVAPFMDSKIIGKEPGTDYDNAFMKTYIDTQYTLPTVKDFKKIGSMSSNSIPL